MRVRSAALVTTVLFAAHGASAQATSVATARQLAISGIDAVESGNCDKGAPLLERAEQLHHASVHLQYLARCRVGAGRLVAATELWRQIIRDGAPEGSSPAVVAAVAEAQSELEKTLPRLASTTVRTASAYPGLTLAIDGTTLPSDIVGAPQILDPGDHELVVTAPGFEKWSRRWTLAEGGTAELAVELTALPAGIATVPPEGQSIAPRRKQSFLGPAGWVTASVGAASLIAGAVTLLAASSRRSDLARTCPDEGCPPGSITQSKLDDDKNAVRDLTTASNVLLFGGALLAGGATMIFIAGRGSSKEPGTALLVGTPRTAAGLTVQGRW